MARCNVEALNRALQEVPVEQVRVHVCWGNYAGPHHQEIDGPGVSGDVMKMVQGDLGRCRKYMCFSYRILTCLRFERGDIIFVKWNGDPVIQELCRQDISAEHVWPLLGEVKAKYLLLEGANPRHRRDVQCFEMAVQKGYFKSHQAAVPPTSKTIQNWEIVQVCPSF